MSWSILLWVAGGLIGLLVCGALLCLLAYLIGRAVSRGRIDAWLDALRRSKR